MSTSPTTAPPYQIATSNDHTKIHKTPVTFHGQDFLTTATQWTKKRIFSREGSGNVYDQVATSPPTTARIIGANGSLPSLDAPSVTFGPNGEAVVAYTGCVQLWLFGSNCSGDAYVFAGSTYGIEGKIISANLIPGTRQVVVQASKRQNTILEVHALNKQGSSLIHSLVLPPTSSGPGPYHVYCPLDSDYFAVVSENTGLLTLFSTIDFHPLPLSGLETSLGADNAPLFDIKGRWLVFAPKNGSKKNASTIKQTALKLPQEGPLYERIVGNLSSTAAASLKSLSDAGVNGIKAYLNKNGAKQDKNGNPNKAGIPLNKMINNMILGDTQHTSIQIIDIPTQTTICHFAPLYGVSHLSMSPHDTTLATVSLNGDQVYTYDLTFLPFEVSVTGRYVRGKLPAKVRQVIWDGYGGLGVITWEKGSLHWFDKRRSFESANKVWKMSGWGIEQGCFIADGLKNDEGARTQLHLLNQGQVLLADVSSGKCTWKYDLPLGPISPDAAMAMASPVVSPFTSSSEESSDVQSDVADDPLFKLDLDQPVQPTSKSTKAKRSRKKKQGHDISEPAKSDQSRKSHGAANVDPLSYYEMEACLPFPYVHEDRRISIRMFDESKKGAHAHYESVGIDVVADYPRLDLFGCDIVTTPIDFGKPDGQAKFRSSPAKLQELGRRDDDDVDEIKHAMESMVIDSTVRHRRTSDQSLADPVMAPSLSSPAANSVSGSSSSSFDHEVVIDDEKQEPDIADLVDLDDYPPAS